MSRILLRARGPVTLVGGGPVPPGALAEALALAPEAVGADGGGDVALPARRFSAVIGDLDSLAGAERLAREGVAVHRIGEQETTDLEKCLYSVEAPLYLGVGFVGGRIDHDLAAYGVIARRRWQPVVLIGPEDVCFVCPPRLALDLAPGTRVSLFPMAPAVGGVSQGLRWPVTGLAMRPDGRFGTSNEAVGGRMVVGFEGGPVLAILPRALLPAVAALLLAADGAEGGNEAQGDEKDRHDRDQQGRGDG